MDGTGRGAGLRIDKLLWFLRLAGTRGVAQEWAGAGHIRVNGRRIERASATVRQGDVLVLPVADTVRVIEILTIPLRRGPAPEAQACYRAIDSAGGADANRPRGPEPDNAITGRA